MVDAPEVGPQERRGLEYGATIGRREPQSSPIPGVATAEMGRDVIAEPLALLLLGRDTELPLGTNGRLVKQLSDDLAAGTVEHGVTEGAAVAHEVVAGVRVSASAAQLGRAKPLQQIAGGQDGRDDPMSAALMVEQVVRPELRQPEEPRAIDGLRGANAGDQASQWQPREVVARDEALAGQVAVGVEVALLLASALVAQQIEFALGFLLAAPRRLPLVSAQARPVRLTASRFPLRKGCAVEIAPTTKGLIECRR